MKRNRIVWGLVAILVVAAMLAGCEGGTPTATTPATTTPTTTPKITPTPSPTPVPPSKFNLSAPEANSFQNLVMPEFTWAKSTGAETYNLEIATNRSFGNTTVISQAGLKEPSFKVNTPLDWDNVYYWRVTAVNKGGQTLSSDAPFWFTTVIPVELPGQARGLAITPDGKNLIVAYEQAPGKIAIIALEKTPSIVAEISVKDNPEWVKITPDGRFAITGHSGSWLSVINLADNSVRSLYLSGVASGTGYYDIAITPDGGSLVYETLPSLEITQYLFEVNLSTLAVTRGPAVGDRAETVQVDAITITPDGKWALMVARYGKLIVVDLVSGTRSTQLLSKTKPWFKQVKVTPGGKTAVLVGDGAVWLVDLLTYQVVASIPVSSISDFAISPDGTKIVGMGEWAYEEAFIISLESKAITDVYEVDNSYPRVVVMPDGKKAIALKSNNPYNDEDNMLYVIPMEQP